MKQPRPWAVPLAALLMAASLVLAPREGTAGPAGPEIMPGDPQGPMLSGEPDVPIGPAPNRGIRAYVPLLLVAETRRLEMLAVFVLVDARREVEHRPQSFLRRNRK
jgi:hypothetical protein